MRRVSKWILRSLARSGKVFVLRTSTGRWPIYGVSVMPVGSFDEFSDLSPVAAILQYVYILKNPASPGFKFQENSVLDISKNENLPPGFSKRLFQDDVCAGDGSVSRVVRDRSPAKQLLRSDADR